MLLANLLVLIGNAQVKPNFIFDKASGCSPLTVSFTNTTFGASTNANYNWNFGLYSLFSCCIANLIATITLVFTF